MVDTDFVIRCVFLNINETDETKKTLNIMYSNTITKECRNPKIIKHEGTSNTLLIGIDLVALGNPPKICFSVTASIKGSKLAKVNGILDTMITGIHMP